MIAVVIVSFCDVLRLDVEYCEPMPGNFCCGLILLTYCDYEFCVLVYF